MNNINRIDAYLKNKMSSVERKEFEDEMYTDSNLAYEVEQHQIMLKVLAYSAEKKMNDALDEKFKMLRAEVLEKIPPNQSRKFSIRISRNKLIILSSLIFLLLGLGVLTYFHIKKPEVVYENSNPIVSNMETSVQEYDSLVDESKLSYQRKIDTIQLDYEEISVKEKSEQELEELMPILRKIENELDGLMYKLKPDRTISQSRKTMSDSTLSNKQDTLEIIVSSKEEALAELPKNDLAPLFSQSTGMRIGAPTTLDTTLLTENTAKSNMKPDSFDGNLTAVVLPATFAFDVSNDNVNYTLMLTENIQKALMNSKKINLIDYANVLKEKREILQGIRSMQAEVTNSEKAYRADIISSAETLGVDYIFKSSITNISFAVLQTGLGYSSEITFNLEVISTYSGATIHNESFNVSTNSTIGKSSSQEASFEALNNVFKKVSQFIDKNFLVESPVVRVVSVTRKGLPKKIFINSGRNSGLREGQHLDVAIVEREYNELENARYYTEKIGEIEIIDIQNNFAICKVKSGGEAIKSALQDKENGEVLEVIARSVAYSGKTVLKRK